MFLFDIKVNLDIDWDNSTDYEYVCQPDEQEFDSYKVSIRCL